MKTIWRVLLPSLICIVTSSCQSTPGVQTLLSDGEPDLIPLPQAGFCRDGSVVVTLRNQGPSDADASTTTITFAGSSVVQLPTPSIEGGRIASIPPVTIPNECYAPNCFMQVVVDANDDVDESDETNNTTEQTCPPP